MPRPEIREITLPNGARIRVDGSTGVVTVLAVP